MLQNGCGQWPARTSGLERVVADGVDHIKAEAMKVRLVIALENRMRQEKVFIEEPGNKS